MPSDFYEYNGHSEPMKGVEMKPFDDITNLIINLGKLKNPERICIGNGYILDLDKKYMYLAEKDVKNMGEFRMVEMWQEDS